MFPLSMLRDNLDEVFSPLIVVQTSKQAMLSFNQNFLTPAETFNCFRDFHRKFSMSLGESTGQPKMFNLQPFKMRFVDVEELEHKSEESAMLGIERVIKNTKPDIKSLEKISYDISTPQNCYRFQNEVKYPWFKTIIGSYMSSIMLDQNNSSLNRPTAIISVISALSPDPVDEIKRLNNSNMIGIKKIYGLNNDTYNSLYRLILVVEDKSITKKMNINVAENIEKIRSALKNSRTSDYVHFMIINSNDKEDGNTILDWNTGVYHKKYIKSYFLGEHGEKIAVDNMDSIGDKRGYLFSKDDVSRQNIQIVDKLMMSFILPRYEHKQAQLEVELIEKKKVIKKGFFSFFKKEEVPEFDYNGHYILTPIEKEIQTYADMLFKYKFYELAEVEYKLLYEEIKKKCLKTSCVFLELYIYCSACCLNFDRDYSNFSIVKKPMKDLESNIQILYDLAYQRKNRCLVYRLSYQLNYITEVKLNCDFKKLPTDLFDCLDNLPQSKFDNEFLTKFLQVSLEEMRARMMLYETNSQPIPYRKFAYQTIICSYRYHDLAQDDFAIATTMIACVYYKEHLNCNWHIIQDYIYGPLLGQITFNRKYYQSAIKCSINLMQFSEQAKKDSKQGQIAINRVANIIKHVTEIKDNNYNLVMAEINNTCNLITIAEFDILNTEDYYADKQCPCNAIDFINNKNVSYSIKEITQFQEFRKIIEYFCEKDLGITNRYLQFLEILNCKNLTDKKNCINTGLNLRNVVIGEEFMFKIKLANNYKIPLDDSVVNNFRFVISYRENDSKTFLTAEHIVSEENVKDIISYCVLDNKLDNSEGFVLNMSISALKPGILRFESQMWDEFGITKKFPQHSGAFNKFSTYRVLSNCGKLDINIQGLKETIIIGQIQKGSLMLSNNSSKQIDKIILCASDPSLCGFVRKNFNKFEGNSIEKFDFNFICDSMRVNDFTLLAMYQTENSDNNTNQRYCMYRMKLNLSNSFYMKSHVEQIDPDTRLICQDMLYMKGDDFVKDMLKVRQIGIKSDIWRIDSKFKVIDHKNSLIFYVTLKRKIKGEKNKQSAALQSIPETEVICDDDFSISAQTVSNTSDENLNSFTNDIILDAIKSDKRKKAKSKPAAENVESFLDLVEIFCFWEYGETKSSRLIKKSEKKYVPGISVLTSKNVEPLQDFNTSQVIPDTPKVNVTFNVNLHVKHDFNTDPVCNVEVELWISAKNLKSDSIQIRMLNPYEKFSYDQSLRNIKVYAVTKTLKPLYFWEGVNEKHIEIPKNGSSVKITFTAGFQNQGRYQLNNIQVVDGADLDQMLVNSSLDEDVTINIQDIGQHSEGLFKKKGVEELNPDYWNEIFQENTTTNESSNKIEILDSTDDFGTFVMEASQPVGLRPDDPFFSDLGFNEAENESNTDVQTPETHFINQTDNNQQINDNDTLIKDSSENQVDIPKIDLLDNFFNENKDKIESPTLDKDSKLDLPDDNQQINESETLIKDSIENQVDIPKEDLIDNFFNENEEKIESPTLGKQSELDLPDDNENPLHNNINKEQSIMSDSVIQNIFETNTLNMSEFQSDPMYNEGFLTSNNFKADMERSNDIFDQQSSNESVTLNLIDEKSKTNFQLNDNQDIDVGNTEKDNIERKDFALHVSEDMKKKIDDVQNTENSNMKRRDCALYVSDDMKKNLDMGFFGEEIKNESEPVEFMKQEQINVESEGDNKINDQEKLKEIFDETLFDNYFEDNPKSNSSNQEAT